MIRINLLKQPAKKKKKRWRISPKVFIVPGSIAGIVIISVGIWLLIKQLPLFSGERKRQIIVKDDYAPSSFVSSNAVEDVVNDKFNTKDKLSERGLEDFPYNRLSFIEKVNYELHFAKNICDLFNKTVQPGVEFNRIEADSFNTLKGIGIANSQEKVVSLFKELKENKKVNLLPKPQSKFSGSGSMYTFNFLCKTEFGLNLEAPFLIDAEEIIGYEEVKLLVKRVRDVAADEGVSIRLGPERIDASFQNGYRRIRYHFSGTSSYNRFVSFINSLYDRHVQCAFEKIKLTAVNDNFLEIDANIIFTTSK